MTTALHRNDTEDLLRAAIRHLIAAGLEVEIAEPRPGADDAADGWLSVTGPAGTLLYQVQFKTRVSPGSAVASTRPDRAGRLLIIAPHIPDTVADSLRRQDVHYVDATGNMYLRWAGVLLDVRGRRPERSRPAQPGQPLRLYKSSGLKVLFARPNNLSSLCLSVSGVTL